VSALGATVRLGGGELGEWAGHPATIRCCGWHEDHPAERAGRRGEPAGERLMSRLPTATITRSRTSRGGWRLAACGFLVLWLPAAAAHAQRPARYEPSRSTISPYFGLFQFNTTPLPNYQAFVRPQQQLRYDLSVEASRLDRLERQIQLRETDQSSGLLRQTERETGAPARAATFLDLGGFFPLQQSIRPRR
jgi:hypothetical protein